MIAPHLIRHQLIGLALSEAQNAMPAEIIDKIEIGNGVIWVWAGNKRVTLTYFWNSGGEQLGGGIGQFGLAPLSKYG
jgi:hypothetical protein